MKVYISKYRDHWISPYTMLDYAFFWTDWSRCSRDRRIRSLEEESTYVEHPAWVERWSDRLEPISRAIQWVWDRVHPPVNLVKIDYWDTWSMDHTLSPIILPMLKQLKAAKHGAPFVDDEDVPEHLQSTAAPPKENEYDVDALHFQRWDWVMDEMIYAFECKVNPDWTEKYYTGKADYQFKKLDKTHFNPITQKEESLSELVEGPNHTQKVDWDGMKAEQARITNGFRLFGKYYEGLWD